MASAAPSSPAAAELDVAIIGAGLSGLCLAIKLQQAGLRSFAIIEKSAGVGGTWRDNTYPGAACDVPSHLYSFSFARKTDWSRKFASQAEILGYAEQLVRRYDLAPHLRLGSEIERARFDPEASRWRLRLAGGAEITAKALVSGCGQLNRPHLPEIPGRALFAGKQFHSARWDHGYDLAGKRVAVIGNGASAVQLIPEIAGKVARLHIFQRSANWLMPRGDRAFTAREKLLLRLPLAERVLRWLIYWQFELRFAGFRRDSRIGRLAEALALKHLRRQVADPGLRARLTPDYPIGCKRVLIADDYYPALQRDTVELVTEPIEGLNEDGVVTADGRVRAVDAVIYATGFETTRFLAPMTIIGSGDMPVDRLWQEGAAAYYGMAVPGYPNFFLMYGPNTNLGHNSILFMIECQANYILRCLRRALGAARALEVRQEAMARYQARLEAEMARTVWSAGCRSWYKTDTGKVTNNWSGFTLQYWRRTLRPSWKDFRSA